MTYDSNTPKDPLEGDPFNVDDLFAEEGVEAVPVEAAHAEDVATEATPAEETTPEVAPEPAPAAPVSDERTDALLEKLRIVTEAVQSIANEVREIKSAQPALPAAKARTEDADAAQEAARVAAAKEAEDAAIAAEQARKDEEALAARAAEEARLAAEVLAAEEARIAEEARLAQEAEAQLAEEEAARVAAEQAERLEAERQAEDARRQAAEALAAAEQEAQELLRIAAEQEAARIAAEQEAARAAAEQDAFLAEQARIAEEARQLAAEEQERAIAAEAAEQARIAASAEQARIVAEQEEARIAAERAAEQARNEQLAAEALAARQAAEQEAARLAQAAHDAAQAQSQESPFSSPFQTPIEDPFAQFAEPEVQSISVAPEAPQEDFVFDLPADSPLHEDVDDSPFVLPANSPLHGLDDVFTTEVSPVHDIGQPATLAPEPSYAPEPEVFYAPEPVHEEPVSFAKEQHAPVAAAPQVATLRAPVDPLFGGAIDDPELIRMADASAAIQAGRRELQSKKTKNAKTTVKALPFSSLTKGQPLVATFTSPKGGVGKSSNAMNLGIFIGSVAYAMHQKNPAMELPRVLIIDGDIVQGSLALRLSGAVKPNMYTLFNYIDDRKGRNPHGTAADAWPSVYSKHELTDAQRQAGEISMDQFVMSPPAPELAHVNLLAAPDEPDMFYEFGPADYQEMLSQLGRYYDVIIIDAGTEIIMDSNRAWLSNANEVYLMTAPEVDTLWNCQKAARVMTTSNSHPNVEKYGSAKLPALVNPENLSVVMTKFDAKGVELNVQKQVNDMFGLANRPDKKFFIPDLSADMLKANNKGDFLVLGNTSYATVIGEIAQQLFKGYGNSSTAPRALPVAR